MGLESARAFVAHSRIERSDTQLACCPLTCGGEPPAVASAPNNLGLRSFAAHFPERHLGQPGAGRNGKRGSINGPGQAPARHIVSPQSRALSGAVWHCLALFWVASVGKCRARLAHCEGHNPEHYLGQFGFLRDCFLWPQWPKSAPFLQATFE